MTRRIELIALWIAPLVLLFALGCNPDDPVTAGPPAAPSQLAVNGVSLSTITLGWSDDSDNESGFKVERAPGGTNTFALLATLDAGTTQFTDDNLPQNSQFCYRIQAVNSAGASDFATPVCGQTAATPNPPSNLDVSSTTTSQIDLVWTDNSNNENGFKIERAPGATTNFAEIATVGANVVAYSDTGLGPGLTFTYRVRAFNGNGDSAYSNTITRATGVPPPSPPSNLALSSKTANQVSMSWTDNSSDETGFRIERAPGGTPNFAQVGTVGAGVTSFTNGGLNGNTSYTYRVRAFNGGGDSNPSNTFTTTTLVSFGAQVYPLFSPTCTGCHTGAGAPNGLDLSANASSVYTQLLSSRVSTATPCNSLILKRPSQTDCIGGFFPHTGGALWPVSGNEYQTTLTWIQQGALNN